MIGVFDSGDGGLLTVEKIRELSADADICFLADRDNAPYGTKSRSEIISLVKTNIRRLRTAGAEKILIACCTASSVYPYLNESERQISLPIIHSTAKEAVKQTKSGRIGVIATRATVLSGAFEKSIKSTLPDASVFSEETQELVSMIESGITDLTVKKRDRAKIEKILKNVNEKDFDVLILGCTHFPRLEKTISEITGRKTVSSALSGAKEILRIAGKEGNGKTFFL